MTRPVKKILIIAKAGDGTAASISIEMSNFLTSRGVDVTACEHSPGSCMLGDEAVGQYDLIIVLGGDGTFIGVARQMHFLNAPLMGVNLGQVGFLTQLHRDHWRAWLDKVLAEGFEVATRLTLDYEIFRQGESVHQGLAVNDLVISRGELARLIRLNVSFDGMDITTLRSDGLIISTPTGSSAYGVSAGGPLIHAGLDVYCVTPVCPFLNSFKPMIFPGSGVTRVRVEEVNGEVNLTEDGQFVVGLRHGDEIVVRKAAADMQVVDLGPDAYFEKLKKHGFLTER